MAVNDETCIALALLHGCAFRTYLWHQLDVGPTVIWYASPSPQHPYDPAERAMYERTCGYRYWFQSREELARVYCETHKLLGDAHAED